LGAEGTESENLRQHRGAICVGVDTAYDDSEVSYVDNRVSRTLIERIVAAKKRHKRFRAYIVLPVMPATEASEASDLRTAAGYSSRQQILLNALSVSQGARSFLETLERELAIIAALDQIGAGANAGRSTMGNNLAPQNVGQQQSSGNNPDSAMAQWPLSSEFVSFCSLRQYCTMPDGRRMSEQIYVHSKVMIADDRRAIVGSANINDRSLLGDRDCEFSCLIEQNQATIQNSFARSLRMKLWREHFNLLDCEHNSAPSRSSKVKTAKYDAILARPESDACWQLWTRTAAQNTVWFRKEVGVWPDTTQRTWSDLELAQQEVKEGKSRDKPSSSRPFGRLVGYPFHFLADEDLSKPYPAIVPPTRIFA
jgi:phosphatidylserine/phosphatidylglycerophosphate/cardiolipin synthase-like enzyme